MRRLIPIINLFCSVFLCYSCAEASPLWYEISFSGNKIGYLYIEVEQEGERKTVRTKSEIEVEMFFINVFELKSEEEATLDDKGIRSYRSVTTINGEKWTVSGEMVEDVLRLKVSGEGKDWPVSISKRDYDITSLDSPQKELAAPGDGRKYRVLNFDELEMEEWEYHWKGEEGVEFEGEERACRVIEFSKPNEKGRQWYWMSEDGLVMLKEEGEDEDGPYSVMLTDKDSAMKGF